MMDTPLLVAAVLLSGVSAALALFVLLRHSAGARADERVHESLHGLSTRLEVLKAQGVDLERDLRQDLAIQRNEQANAAQMLRTEVGEQTTRFTHTTQQQFAAHTQAQSEQLKAFAEGLSQLQQTMLQQLSVSRSSRGSMRCAPRTRRSSTRCAPRSTRSWRRHWSSGWARRSSRSPTASSRCIAGWARCRRSRRAWATSSAC
jgi:hypothetical protein